MSAQWKDLRASQEIRAKALQLHVDGRARLSGISALERGRFLHVERHLSQLEQPVRALETWQSCLRVIRLNLSRTGRWEELPACGGTPRIALMARWLWEAGEEALTEPGFVTLCAACAQAQPLTLSEVWLLPQAVRLCALRAFFVDTDTLERMIGQRDAAISYLSGGPFRPTDDIFFETVLRASGEPEHAARCVEVRRWLEEVGESAEEKIDRAHEQQAALILRLDKVRRMLRLLDDMRWQDHIADVSRAEQMLRQDPGKVYPSLTEESQEAVRRMVERLSHRTGLAEKQILRTAMEVCRADGSDLTQVLMTDEGLARLQTALNVPKAKRVRRFYDPKGHWIMGGSLALALLLFVLFTDGRRGLVFALLLLPVCWRMGRDIFNRVATSLVAPRPLLKMKLDSIPGDMRTLVTVPARVASVEELQKRLAELEAYGVLSADENIEYLLLADFPEADQQHLPEDDDVMEVAQRMLADIRERTGRDCWHVLWRERMFNERDGIFQPKERKRGALMALYALLTGGKSEFIPQKTAVRLREGQFKYVVTLDAETIIHPDSIRQLVGAMAWPGNRFAVIQPHMHNAMKRRSTPFDALFWPDAGMSAYPTCACDLYRDLTGRGIFGGKGIVDVAAFRYALEGRLPDDAILSHDLIEGAIAGAGFADDVAWFEGQPGTLKGMASRSGRWTRGDWQLLPFLLDRSQPLDGLSRFQMADNLVGSLFAPAEIGLLLYAAWMGSRPALVIALVALALPLLLNLPDISADRLRGLLARLCVLPLTAWTALDAIVRALYRTYVSHRHMLEWTTAANAEGHGGAGRRQGIVAAILLLPAVRHPHMWVAAVALAGVFTLGMEWVRQCQKSLPAASPGEPEKEFLADLARRTWAFFEENVNAHSHFLPPDNVQLDPPLGAAPRTSPTNIGMYLIGCVAARALGLVDASGCDERIARTVDTLEALPRWKGHLYNWYDTGTLKPLPPEYVSSVDSGNLAACLLLTAHAVTDGALSQRLYSLARRMDFSALYDSDRNLFHIGLNAADGELSRSHYDLFASESRILSLAAMMLGQVPTAHWARLGRPMTKLDAGAAHVSWSGTMFEYLMPELLFTAPEGSAWHHTSEAVVAHQIRNAIDGLWGVSESGYSAFDLNMNYQYRAFGLPEVSFEGRAPGGVIAPYAAALALKYRPGEAAANLRRMAERGYLTRYGLIEAVDFRTGAPRCVLSHMAHHQGMILCAVANVLCDDVLPEQLRSSPRLRALEALFQEEPVRRVPDRQAFRYRRTREHAPQTEGRTASQGGDMHLMRGRDSDYAVNADGVGRLRMGGLTINRFLEDFRLGEDGLGLFVQGGGLNGSVSLRGGANVFMRPGSMTRILESGAVKLTATECLSPEDGAWFLRVELENRTQSPLRMRLISAFPVAMTNMGEMRAHPAFHALFIRSQRVGQHAVGFQRRSRETEADERMLIHMAAGVDGVEWETDAERFYGRAISPMDDEVAARPLSGTLGFVTRPCSALAAQLTLTPGTRRSVHFAIGLTAEGDAADWVKRHEADSAALRAIGFAEAQAQAMLGFVGLDREAYAPVERAARLLIDPHRHRAWNPLKKADLWSQGISGDLPLLGVRVPDEQALPLLREACRARSYYHMMGLETDLIVFYREEAGYRRPLADWIQDAAQTTGEFHRIDVEHYPLHEALFQLCQIRLEPMGSGLSEQLTAQLDSMTPPTKQSNGWTALPPEEIAPALDNGFGGFLPDGRYAMRVSPEKPTPAPWANILAGEGFGTLITERGGGFTWAGNSHDMRLTRFYNQTMREGWSESVEILEPATGRRVSALPVPGNSLAFNVVHGGDSTTFSARVEPFSFCVQMGVAVEWRAKIVHVTMSRSKGMRVAMHVDWLMGSNAGDLPFLCARAQGNICFASGNMDGVGYLVCLRGGDVCAEATGDGISAAPVEGCVDFALGWAQNEAMARDAIRQMQKDGGANLLAHTALREQERLDAIAIDTPDELLNDFVNHLLPRQVFASRIHGRTGLYQGGGAFGFRDQLQDMLCALYFQPELAREHILDCAAHQFEAGDVMHWWHPPYRGVRTRISDDMLFLPYVTAIYVEETGDAAILDQPVAYLADQAIPEGKEDIYFEAQPSTAVESLRLHCIRALEHACRTGEHGLLLIGSGDWNDGMNRVGAKGRGESVWLTQFLCVVIEKFAPHLNEAEREHWQRRREQLLRAVEENAWDGEWYLRAYDDEGKPLGSHDCAAMKIDCLSQAWAQMAGLNPQRVSQAMEAVKRQLMDESLGIIRLLTPAFDMHLGDPGYIRAYPPGIRENGGQYTHAACWVVRALARMGDAAGAWKALHMLLPYNHARTEEEARHYRVEPYVLAADVGGEGMNAGRGGWTWYTGSAAWLYRVMLEDVLGYERRGNRVRMCALLGPGWPSAKVKLRFGSSSYTLESAMVCRQAELDGMPQTDNWVEMIDDGAEHRAVFPARQTEN